MASTQPQSQSYYRASAQQVPLRPTLNGNVNADICVVGGGIAGCSAALHLAERGYRVALLEAERIGHGASGRSGGQLLPGYSCGQHTLVRQLGVTVAKDLWDVSVASIALTMQLIATHNIECDLHYGHLNAAIKPRQRAELLRHQRELESVYDYRSLRLLERDELRALLDSPRYLAALYDSASAHLHPLNYTLGLAKAAAAAGALIYERSPVTIVQPGTPLHVVTTKGSVTAAQVILCCNTEGGKLSAAMGRRIAKTSTFMIATGILGAERAQSLIRNNAAVSDSNFIVDYFRRSSDQRLLFGGRVSYSGHDFRDSAAATRQRMLMVFPQLHDADIDYVWSGNLDLTRNRAPDFGRLNRNLYFLQGFSGHGLALAGMAGKLVSDAIAGHAERFDVFTRIKHRNFPGGPLRMPALVLAMLWYRLRDIL